jgi:hypothetical protein
MLGDDENSADNHDEMMVLTYSYIQVLFGRMSKRTSQLKPLKKLYSVRLDPELISRMREIKARDGVPESEQIRRGLQLWFEQKGVKPKGKK